MRTSRQLNETNQCPHHPKTSISRNTDASIQANAQKQVIRRIMMGEPISDVKDEIDSILMSRGFQWETRKQRSATLRRYDALITRFLAWANVMHAQYPDPAEDTTVNFFGEDIKALPDFYTFDGNKVYVTKIETSRYSTESADIQKNEAYALGLLGEKLFPDKEVYVRFCHLQDAGSQSELQAINRPFDDRRFQKISTLKFDDRAKEWFNDRHQEETAKLADGCSGKACEGCSMFNVCHYTEPAISIPVAERQEVTNQVVNTTSAQDAVINFEQGQAVVNAGAGAGKTFVVANRIAKLIEKGYKPEDMCLLTFTKTGAEEMTARVVKYCAAKGILIDPDRFVSTTFNAFCQKLINDHYEELGYTRKPRIIPEETKSGIINHIIDSYDQVKAWNTKTAMADAKKCFAKIKKEGLTRDSESLRQDILFGGYDPESLNTVFQMYDTYTQTLFDGNYVEFDDQILEAFRLVEMHPTLFNEIVTEEDGTQHGFKHVIVDEFQDTDLPQIELLKKIIDNESIKSFMAVGDDSQSIFGFRNTSPEFIINFENYFGVTQKFPLVENHRSTANVINFANTVNDLSHDKVIKDLIPTKQAGSDVGLKCFYTPKQEYEYIANEIKQRIEAGQDPKDIAVLMSDKNELTAMADALTKIGVPSVLMNPIPYISNSRVCAICTFYDSFVNGSSQGMVDYYNAANSGVLKGATAEQVDELISSFTNNLDHAEKTIEKFVEYANAMDPDQIDEGYQQFLDKIRDCENMEELANFFRDFDLYGRDSTFKREGKYEGVCLITVHSAKGLEWNTTYLSLSHFDRNDWHRNENRFTNGPDHDESIRKWFVGATRAKEELIVTGQYVVPKDRNSRKDDFYLNRFLRKSCEILGRPYEYSGTEYSSIIAEERAANEANRPTANVLSGVGYFRPNRNQNQANNARPTQENSSQETNQTQGNNRARALANPFRRPAATPPQRPVQQTVTNESHAEPDDLEERE
jgi:superfamily I DNA/RNA helicase